MCCEFELSPDVVDSQKSGQLRCCSISQTSAGWFFFFFFFFFSLYRHIWFLKDALSQKPIHILTINTSNDSVWAHALTHTALDLISSCTSCVVIAGVRILIFNQKNWAFSPNIDMRVKSWPVLKIAFKAMCASSFAFQVKPAHRSCATKWNQHTSDTRLNIHLSVLLWWLCF